MQGVNNQGTINILIDSSVKQKLNLHLGQTYEARVFSVSEDGKVILKIGGSEIVAESKVPLQPGQKILVEVKENANGMILLQIKNNSSLADISQTNLIRESIINNLQSLNLPLKEENIVISQGLIKYNLRVSSENIQKVLNRLVSSGYQNELSDYNIVESGALLFAKGLPITRETIELARFLKQEKGQVINNIAELDNEIDKIIETSIKNLQQPEGEISVQKFSKAVLKEVLINLPNKLGEELVDALNIKEFVEQNPENVAAKGKEVKDSKVVNDSKEQLQLSSLKHLSKESLEINSKELGANPASNFLRDIKVINETSSQENITNKQELKTKEQNLSSTINKPITDTTDDNNTIVKNGEPNKVLTSEKVLENLKTLTNIKELLSKAFLNIETDQGKNNSGNIVDTIKNVARYMVEGEKSLEGDLHEKFQGSLKELVAKILLDNILVKQENNQNKLVNQHSLESTLKEQLGKLEGNFNDINKHYEAVKLYNNGINDSTKDNLNNYYLLSLPTLVAGEKFDNKVYFWSQSNKKRKIDPENMRIVLCLNTKSLGLLKIDLTVVRRDIYAGIEVTDLKVQDFIQVQSSALTDQLASHKYRLKSINCTLKKPEDITSTPSQMPEHFTALDLKV